MTNELFLKDLNLKKYYSNQLQGPLPQNFFERKPWVQYYPEKPLTTLDLNATFFDNYIEASKKRLDKTVIHSTRTGKRYTNKELIDMTNCAISNFLKMGVTSQDTIGVLLQEGIEEAVTFLSLNKIGCQLKYIDYMKSVPDMIESVERENLKMIIADTPFLELLPLLNPQKKKCIIANSEGKQYEDLIPYEQLYEKINDTRIEIPTYDSKKVTIKINSSGTTGRSKPINHTNYSINAAVQKMMYAGYPISEGNVLIKNIPSSIGLGLITTLYTGLISGAEIIMLPTVRDTEQDIANFNSVINYFPEYKKKYKLPENAKINAFTAPFFIYGLVEDPNVTDLSHGGALLGAGSKMSKEKLTKLETIAEKKGYTLPFLNGYGQNEMAGAIALNTLNHNKNGSAGYPVIGTEIRIVDPKTHELLNPNEEGLIIERSDSAFSNYDNMPEESKEAIITLKDGKKWFNSKDIGHMDENGFIFIKDRTDRIVKINDFKIALDNIELKINTLPEIKDSAAIISNAGGSMEEIAIFFEQALQVSEEEIINSIKNCNLLSQYEMPTEFYLIDKIPYKGNGKKDYQQLKELRNSLINQRKRVLKK